MASVEDGLVDVAMAAFAQQFLVREVVSGSLKVTVVKMLDLDGFLVSWAVNGFGLGRWSVGVGGYRNGGFSFTGEVSHHR